MRNFLYFTWNKVGLLFYNFLSIKRFSFAVWFFYFLFDFVICLLRKQKYSHKITASSRKYNDKTFKLKFYPFQNFDIYEIYRTCHMKLMNYIWVIYVKNRRCTKLNIDIWWIDINIKWIKWRNLIIIRVQLLLQSYSSFLIIVFVLKYECHLKFS